MYLNGKIVFKDLPEYSYKLRMDLGVLDIELANIRKYHLCAGIVDSEELIKLLHHNSVIVYSIFIIKDYNGIAIHYQNETGRRCNYFSVLIIDHFANEKDLDLAYQTIKSKLNSKLKLFSNEHNAIELSLKILG